MAAHPNNKTTDYEANHKALQRQFDELEHQYRRRTRHVSRNKKRRSGTGHRTQLEAQQARIVREQEYNRRTALEDGVVISMGSGKELRRTERDGQAKGVFRNKYHQEESKAHLVRVNKMKCDVYNDGKSYTTDSSSDDGNSSRSSGSFKGSSASCY